MFSHGVVFAQTVTNPGFESGTTGWTCDMEVNAASVYGGTGSDKVAEVDGHTNASSTADDRLSVSYTHLRAHETLLDIVCRLLLEKKKHLLAKISPLSNTT